MILSLSNKRGILRLFAVMIVAQGLISIPLVGSVQVQEERTFNVNIFDDLDDFERGDGRCDVNRSLSGDQCSLRAAISEANQTDALDTINLPAGVYRLTQAGNIDDFNVAGDLDVYKDVKIVGQGSQNTTIDATDSSIDFVFHIGAASQLPSTVTIENVRITGAVKDGIYLATVH